MSSYILRIENSGLSVGDWVRFVDTVIDLIPQNARVYGKLNTGRHIYFFEADESGWDTYGLRIREALRTFSDIPYAELMEVDVKRAKEFGK